MPGQYAKGAHFERQVKDFLEQDGWVVIRSAGSHSVSDLVAIEPGPIVRLIQCKVNGKLKPEERVTLLRLESFLNIVPMLAYKEKGKIKLEQIKSKEPNFIYEYKDGKFTKVENE